MIARSLQIVTPPVARLLRLSFGGRLDPTAREDESTQARDAQFELWLAAFFAAGDRKVITLEPDLVTTYWFQWLGVAAKRVQSIAKIGRRVRRAARQVKTHLPAGFVALAIDSYSPGFATRLATLRSGRRLFAKLPEINRAVEWCRAEAPWIRAVICFAAICRITLKTQPPHVGFYLATRVYLLPEDERDRKRLRDYFEEIFDLYVRRSRDL
jgi:hypothetical protein